jgi:hypothetical protein
VHVRRQEGREVDAPPGVDSPLLHLYHETLTYDTARPAFVSLLLLLLPLPLLLLLLLLLLLPSLSLPPFPPLAPTITPQHPQHTPRDTAHDTSPCT